MSPPHQSPLNDRSYAQKFMEEYDQILRDAVQHRDDNVNLRVENANLLSEVNMLREAWERSEASRIRLERMSSALVARLGVIQETITVAARDAIKEGTTEPNPKRGEMIKVETGGLPIHRVVPTPQNALDAADDDALRDLVQRLPRVGLMT